MRSILFLAIVTSLLALAIDPPKSEPKGEIATHFKKLPDFARRVMCDSATEPPGSGVYNKFWEKGTYHCAACGRHLFSSQDKYDSKSGWPSFVRPAYPEAVGEKQDESYGMVRTEVHCANCKGHLGHVFKDGPEPTGLRYCINSVSLSFTHAPKSAAE